LNETVAQSIACPSCTAASLYSDSGQLRCRACGSAYPIVDGTPVLLAELNADVGKAVVRPLLETLPGRLRPVVERWGHFIRPLATHRSRRSRGLTPAFIASFPPEARILNVGSGTQDYGRQVTNVDIAPMPGIDVVGVAERLPFRDETFDGVVFQAVLEHVHDSHKALREIRRVLRPGGAVFVDVPFIQGFHPAPQDNRRYTETGLRAELEQHGFVVQQTGVAVGPASAMAWISAEFLALLLSGRSARRYRYARVATDWLVWPIKWADAWLDQHEMAHVIASGVWARAKRPH
jgi:SAM-dependent methyltransferase